MGLSDFCFARDDAFLIPVEGLGADGLTPDFAAELGARGVAPDWLARFDLAWRESQARLGALVTRAPRHWFPPRRTHVVVAREPRAAHPYYRPLFESASLLYAGDVDPATSSLELTVLLLLQAERLHLAENPTAALLANLSYLLTLDDAQRADLAAGVARNQRPDVAGYRALVAALGWLTQLEHTALRPPAAEAPRAEIDGTGLLLQPADQARLEALLQAFGEAGAHAVAAHRAHHAAGAGAAPRDALLEWLASARPELLIVGAGGDALWDVAEPAALERLRAALGPLSAGVAAGIRADLTTIDAVTRRFLDALGDADALPAPTEAIDQHEGVYLHQGRKRIAYALTQPTWSPRLEPAPPFARLALAARVGHEWGHLCEEAGLVAPTDAAHAAATLAVAAAARALVADLPPPLAQVVTQELARQGGVDPGDWLVDFVLARIPDYAANLVARRLLDPAALQTYVRVNVRGHLGERLPPLRLLAGLAIEFQYLALAEVRDPLDVFLGLCPAAAILLGTGFVAREHLERLFAAVAELCATYAVDPSLAGPA